MEQRVKLSETIVAVQCDHVGTVAVGVHVDACTACGCVWLPTVPVPPPHVRLVTAEADRG